LRTFTDVITLEEQHTSFFQPTFGSKPVHDKGRRPALSDKLRMKKDERIGRFSRDGDMPIQVCIEGENVQISQGR
jgi:hypothetical protein